jgi:23S rRNA (pseudouridine1915-N3)-methyltransferase
MQVVVIAVGKLKEKYWREALAEYAKRLSAYVQLEIVEVQDEPSPEQLSDAGRAQVLRVEGARIEKHLRDRDGIVVLDLNGKMLDSKAWSQKYDDLRGQGFGRLVFIIGGSNGLDDSIRRRSAFRWCFGPITLPHQLARIVLVEQLYRGIRILRGEPYHK